MATCSAILAALTSSVRREIWRSSGTASCRRARSRPRSRDRADRLSAPRVRREAGSSTMEATATSGVTARARTCCAASAARSWVVLEVDARPTIFRNATSRTARRVRAVVVATCRRRHRPGDDLRCVHRAAVYSRWLGVPVTIDDGGSRATMEWGTRVRGAYEHVCRAGAIALRWYFEATTSHSRRRAGPVTSGSRRSRRLPRRGAPARRYGRSTPSSWRSRGPSRSAG